MGPDELVKYSPVACLAQISAKHGQGVDDLLEQILLQAEVAELTANPQRPARGTVIEAHLDRRRGPVASLLVQAGTLRIGDMVVASASYGKVGHTWLTVQSCVRYAGAPDTLCG